MAAISRTNPIILTNANVGDTTTDDVYIREIIWVAPTTQDAVAILKNRRGQVIYHQTAPQALQASQSVYPEFSAGLTVDTLDNGILYVFLR